ncbi:hypothetical protein EV421DRAFT_2022822 [Armillaria borealis]|uniref:Uncharacterized protein n=1 Tax=Armillaria borealis TaxID=47425 RepID=A0AA39J3B2_9AGAR|nr:hypothetical protein EV421DRAFT_2022822 [Armillaria borealis]
MLAPTALRSMPTKASLISTEAKITLATKSTSGGGSTAGVFTAHLRKFHGDVPPSSGAIMQPVPENSAYERETTVESSASSWSNCFEVPTNDVPNPGETFMDKLVASSFSNKGARFDQPMSPLAPTTKGNFIWTSPATGFQHGNVRYSPEAKQLYPAASTNFLDDVSASIRSWEVVEYSYGSMTDTTGRMIMFDTPTLADAPWGYQYAPLPIYRALPQAFVPAAVYPGSVQASWNGSNVGASTQTMGYGSIEAYRRRSSTAWTSSNGSPECDLPGPWSNETHDVDDQEQYRYG